MSKMTPARRAKRRQNRFEKRLTANCGRGKYLKFAYPNMLMALAAADRMLKEGGHINPLHIYECSYCQGIHIGHLGREESRLMYESISINIRELQEIE
jgi:hypothetical protein